MNQIQSLHDFVYGIVRGLSPTNHDGTLTQGCVGDPICEMSDDKGNALIHQPIQIGRDTGHLRHHANLKKQTKKNVFVSVKVMKRRRQKTKSLTDIR